MRIQFQLTAAGIPPDSLVDIGLDFSGYGRPPLVISWKDGPYVLDDFKNAYRISPEPRPLPTRDGGRAFTGTLEIAKDLGTKCHITAFFREPAMIGVDLAHARGLSLHQTRENFIFGNVDHLPEAGEGECTVWCPRSGHQKTGINVCLDCESSRGMIKICC